MYFWNNCMNIECSEVGHVLEEHETWLNKTKKKKKGETPETTIFSTPNTIWGPSWLQLWAEWYFRVRTMTILRRWHCSFNFFFFFYCSDIDSKTYNFYVLLTFQVSPSCFSLIKLPQKCDMTFTIDIPARIPLQACLEFWSAGCFQIDTSHLCDHFFFHRHKHSIYKRCLCKVNM